MASGTSPSPYLRLPAEIKLKILKHSTAEFTTEHFALYGQNQQIKDALYAFQHGATSSVASFRPNARDLVLCHFPCEARQYPFNDFMRDEGQRLNEYRQYAGDRRKSFFATPPGRLFFCCVQSALPSIGCFSFGWTSFSSIAWIAPVLGIVCAIMGVFNIYLTVFNYGSRDSTKDTHCKDLQWRKHLAFLTKWSSTSCTDDCNEIWWLRCLAFRAHRITAITKALGSVFPPPMMDTYSNNVAKL